MELIASAYLPIKAAHIGLAMLSGAVFAGRGLGVLLGSTLPMSRGMKRASMLIDTALLVAALLLLSILHLNPLTTPWLLVKLGLLVAYIALGIGALGRIRNRTGRLVAWLLALLCFTQMMAIASSHDPAGMLRPLL